MTTKAPRIAWMLAAGLLLCGSARAGDVLYVRESAPPGGDGSGWTTAFRALQSALDTARASGGAIREIRVAAGTYEPDQTEDCPEGDGDREAWFELVDGVALLGGYAGVGKDPDARDIDVFLTTLSADLERNDEPEFVNYDDNGFSVVVTFETSAATILDGFTVRGAHCEGSPDAPGGLYTFLSDLTVTRRTFRDCIGVAVNVVTGAATLSRCLVTNTRESAPGANCPSNSSAGMALSGEGNSSIVVECDFVANETCGMTVTCSPGPSVMGCVFESNMDGGLRTSNGTLTRIANCLFINNWTDGMGGGIYNGYFPTITNCTFVGNTAVQGGGAIVDRDDPFNAATVSNCILWGNSKPEILDLNAPIVVRNSIVQGGWPDGENIIDADPMFTDGLRPGAGSPAISGDNKAVPGFVTTDFDGLPRFVDDPCTTDTGAPPGAVHVDLGAFEFQPPCPVDLDCSGAVGFTEVLAVLTAWGNAGGPEDLDGSGTVDFGDVLVVLGAWGPCAS